MIIVTAWNNSKHHANGAGYGLKLDSGDRDRFIQKAWNSLVLELDGHSTPVTINIAKRSFGGRGAVK